MVHLAKHARTAVVAVVVLVALLGLAAPASAVLSGRNGSIVFTSGRNPQPAGNDNLAQLFRITPNGSSGSGTIGAPLTGVGGQSRHPGWSPDRTKIVFANGTPGSPTTESYQLFIRDLVANTTTPLVGTGTFTADHPAWSPDGTKIAYEQAPSAGSADRNIMVKTVGNANPAVPLTTSTDLEFKPAWTPDSQTLYYAKTVVHPNPDYDIVRQPAGGGAETPVLNASGADEYQPSISPDGTKICFTLQTMPGGPGSGSQTADVYVASLPTPSALTLMSSDATKGDINCTWSPNGARIAYVNGTFGQGRVLTRAVTGQPDLREIAEDQGTNNFDGNPDWAPDGSPDCPDGTVTTPRNTAITIRLECTDTGPAYERSDPNGTPTDPDPANGTLSDFSPLTNPSTVKYTPKQNFTGTDKIAYTAFDAAGFGTDNGTVTVTVLAPIPPGGGGPINGTDGNDTINGTAGDDVINCGAGDDVVNGGGGDDTINCGAGKDRIDGGAGNDRISGSLGDDRVNGGSGNDRVNGNRGRDRVSGGSGRDRVGGSSGNDRVDGGSGNDRVNGDSGNDRVSGGKGNDRVAGGRGNDRVGGDSGRDRLSGGSGRDRLNGGSGRDRCGGDSGRDSASRCEVKSRIP